MATCGKNRCPKAARRGAAAVEMAFVGPVILLFALAATDLGRVVHVYTAVSNAARCGAEQAGMHGFTTHTKPAWETKVREAVADEMRGLGDFQSSQLEVDVVTTNDADGLFRAAVTVNYPFQTVVAWPGLPAAIMLGHRVEMRRIQ